VTVAIFESSCPLLLPI